MTADDDADAGDHAGAGPIRIDKWLWHARFFKTRSLAARMVSEGRVRVNSVRVTRPGRTLAPGDVLTFAQGDAVRVVRVRAPGTRRGPAPEARALYDDLAPPPGNDPSPQAGPPADPTA
jgi:ribosome-associated heat shock protein Hsp15